MMKRLMVLLIISAMAIVVYAGMDKSGDILYNLLEIQGYSSEQISEMMDLPRFPTFDSTGMKLQRGDQLYIGPDYETVIVLSVNNANNSVMFNKDIEKQRVSK